MSLRSREIVGHMKAHGHERGTVLCLQVLAEEQHAIREAVANLAEMLNKMSDILVDVANVSQFQAESIDSVKKTMGVDDGHDSGVQTKNG